MQVISPFGIGCVDIRVRIRDRQEMIDNRWFP